MKVGVFSSKMEAVFLVKPMTQTNKQTNKQTNEKGSRFAVQTKLTENLTVRFFYFIITNILPLTFFKRSILLPYFYETSIPLFRSIDYKSVDTKIYIVTASVDTSLFPVIIHVLDASFEEGIKRVKFPIGAVQYTQLYSSGQKLDSTRVTRSLVVK